MSDTPITDHASIETDAFDSPAKAREFARRLERDRAALMKNLAEIAEMVSRYSGSSLSFGVIKTKADKSLAAARKNFPTESHE
jgi:hypothetical protein